MLAWLNGKKTYLGAVLLAGLGLVGSLDALVHSGTLTWFTEAQYVSFGTLIAGLTGAAMRLAVKRLEPPKE